MSTGGAMDEQRAILGRLPSYRAPATTSLTLSTVVPVPRSASTTRLSDSVWAGAGAGAGAWRSDSQDRLVAVAGAGGTAARRKGKGKAEHHRKATTFVVGAPSSGSGDDGDAEGGTHDLDLDSDDASVRHGPDGRELGVEDIIRWQVRQPVYTVDAQDLDSLLPLGIGDYTFVLANRRSRPPSPSPAAPAPSTSTLPPAPPRLSLGKGKFSEVLLVRKNGVEYALKHTPLHPHHPLIATRLLREPTILAQLLPHPNLVSVNESIRTPGHFYLVEENLRDSVTLEHLVANSPNGVLAPALAWSVLEQLASVVRSLHVPLRVCHRDIKPENILVKVTPSADPNDPPTLLLKLLDFGLATHYSASEPKLTTCCGSPAYHSPELWRSLREPSGTVKYWGPEVDIWCLGLTLLRCLTPTKYPLGIAHSSLFALSDKVVDALLTVTDESLRRTLAGMMQMDGAKRMRAFERYCGLLEDGKADSGFDELPAQTKEFKSTTFLPAERRHSLDLPLASQRRRPPPTPDLSAFSTVLPQSRSPSRSRQRRRSIPPPSPAFDSPTIAEMTPPHSPDPDRVPALSPTGTTTSDSLPGTPRQFSRSRASLPAPLELVLLNPTDEPIRRAASYIKYALRCAGILYHVRESDLPSDQSPEDDEATFVCHLQCVLRLPADPTSKASSALIAALRPPITRAQTLGAPVRSSSTPPVGKSASPKKKEDVKAVSFFLSIRKAADLAQHQGVTHFTARAPPTTTRRRHGGDRVVVALSDARALSAVRDALRSELDPAADDERARGRAARSHHQAQSAGLGLTIDTPTAVVDSERKGGGGFFDFVGRFPGLGSRTPAEMSPATSTPTTPVELPVSRTASQVHLDEERSRAMAAAFC